MFSEIFLPATIAVITLGLGLTLTVKDLGNVFFYPRGLVTGLLCQLVLLPIIAFTIAWITRLGPELAVGLVLISVCPGGATSNLINYLVRNNVALTISLTAVNSIITVFTIPLITQIALVVFMDQDAMIRLSFTEAVTKIFLLTVLPAATGILIRRYWEEIALKMEKPLRYLLPILLLLVYSGVLFLESGNGGMDIQRFFYILPFALMLNLIAMVSGLLIPRFLGLALRDQVTIAVDVGLQNSTLAIFVAGTILGNYTIATVAVVYGSFSFFTTWAFGYLARRYLPDPQAGSINTV